MAGCQNVQIDLVCNKLSFYVTFYHNRDKQVKTMHSFISMLLIKLLQLKIFYGSIELRSWTINQCRDSSTKKLQGVM